MYSDVPKLSSLLMTYQVNVWGPFWFGPGAVCWTLICGTGADLDQIRLGRARLDDTRAHLSALTVQCLQCEDLLNNHMKWFLCVKSSVISCPQGLQLPPCFGQLALRPLVKDKLVLLI